MLWIMLSPLQCTGDSPSVCGEHAVYRRLTLCVWGGQRQHWGPAAQPWCSPCRTYCCPPLYCSLHTVCECIGGGGGGDEGVHVSCRYVGSRFTPLRLPLLLSLSIPAVWSMASVCTWWGMVLAWRDTVPEAPLPCPSYHQLCTEVSHWSPDAIINASGCCMKTLCISSLQI